MNTSILSRIRKSKAFRIVSAFLALNLLAEIIAPLRALALTSGPSQPEVQSFEPVGTTDMVDLFTGDFNYNIPLVELPGPNGGYPFNIAYHAGIGMDQEASWVGLGWNLQPGAITREVRGIPDDFKGQEVKKTASMKDNVSFGIGGSMNFELFGADNEKLGGQLGGSIKAYYNNYKGVGYSLSPSFSLEGKSHETNGGLGFNLSLDSQEGVGANASLSLNKKKKDNDYSWGAGIGFNSKRGLSTYIDASKKRDKSDTKQYTSGSGSAGGSSSLSFSEQAYTPIVSSAMFNSDLSISFKNGVSDMGAFSSWSMQGFFNISRLKHKGKEQSYSANGYNYLENAGDEDLSDFNREKDGMVRKESPNLAMPGLTYDYYNIQGQGIGGMFRPYRSDIGHFHDPEVRSTGAGASVGIDASGTATHAGISASISYSNSASLKWDEDNDWYSKFQFTSLSGNTDPAYEKIYYKQHGEYTSFPTTELDYIGGESAVTADLNRSISGLDKIYNPDPNNYIDKSGTAITTPSGAVTRFGKGRMPRNSSVQPINNYDLLSDPGSNSNEMLPEYDVKFYDNTYINNYSSAPSSDVTRCTVNGTNVTNQTGGITVLNTQGMRYVYGLPAYNMKKVECSFSYPAITSSCVSRVNLNLNAGHTAIDYNVSGTDEYYNRSEMGPYAHSYLLTSILGTDYVDVTGDGVTEDDYGYWVKFNYVRTTSSYQWRAPFTGANYEDGLAAIASDNRAAYTYGEKETWYLASAETKTHIMTFHISARHDAHGAAYELNDSTYNNNIWGANSYKLDSLRLFSRPSYEGSSPLPVKVVHFSYSYDLCGNAANNDQGTEMSGSTDLNANHGKLTLKKIWFTYQSNSRGQLSPYVFDYHERLVSGDPIPSGYSVGDINPQTNPGYDLLHYDRWGNYKGSSSACEIKNAPYVKQYNSTTDSLEDNAHKTRFETRADNDAAVWSLRKVTLPTGGIINVSYESDDYAYVQHRTAMQMTPILHFSDAGNPSTIYDGSWSSSTASKRRIYFKLEKPIRDTLSSWAKTEFYNRYMAGLKQKDGTLQMYFRSKMKIRKSSDNVEEFVSGYTDLETDTSSYGIDRSISSQTIDGKSYFTQGYVTVKLPEIGDKTIDYHPFAVAGWQTLRTQLPDLVVAPGNLDQPAGTSKMARALKAKSLISFIPTIGQIFTGFRNYCYSKRWANQADLSNSWIRLDSPDKIKYGGGLRVRKISFDDNWNTMTAGTNSEASSEYGQVYDYTTTEGSNVISSGVAQYEPLIGGDEIALRRAKNYPQRIPVMTDNNLFFEYPINESYFPAPVVGYSKVTVQSIASYRQDLPSGSTEYTSLPAGIITSGITVNEFYTAKDFPVITEQTDILKKPYDLYIPLPFIGQVVTHNMTATQGYAIKLNDMHGKPKAMYNYAKDNQGHRSPVPVSSVQYYYNTKPVTLDDGYTASELNSTLNVLEGEEADINGKYVCNTGSAIVGEEYEFFMDMRRAKDFSATGGLDFNADLLGLIPLPFPWPTIETFKHDMRTLATNKIIHKSGVLVKTVATDGQSTVVTENKLFDAVTGKPLLTTVTNDFNDAIYKYDHPAHWEYDGMSSAYKNAGFVFYGTAASYNSTTHKFTLNTTSLDNANSSGQGLTEAALYELLAEGDEFIMQNATSPSVKFKVTLVEKSSYCDSGGTHYTFTFHAKDNPSAAVTNSIRYKLLVTRSGRRNLLETTAGSITALKDPTNSSNRHLATLTSVSYNGATLQAELVSFLNSILDCNGQLPTNTYVLQGNNSYTTLQQLFSSIRIEPCSETGTCTFCTDANGYHLIYTLRDGTCQYGVCHCFAKRLNSGSFTTITGFQASGTTGITTNYSGGVSSTTCEMNCLTVDVTPKLTALEQVLNASAADFQDYWDYDGWATSCSTPPAGTPSQYNLYAIGKKGTWRPYKDNYYKDERYQRANDVKLSQDGVFDGNGTDLYFYPYNWKPSGEHPVPSQWIPNNYITKYNENGFEVENKDITGVYSSALYGYMKSLPVAVASNARQNEIFYESFDDTSSFMYRPSAPSLGTGDTTTAILAHTGKRSLQIVNPNTGSSNQLTLDGFRPVADGTTQYVISMWTGRTGGPLVTYSNATDANSTWVKVYCYDQGGSSLMSPAPIKPTGNVIDGWQRIEGTFTPPSGTVTVKLEFQGGPSGTTGYFDDIRVFPNAGNMKTYVYDKVTFRLAAELDDNNYATIYSYDEAGNLFLVKKETAAGIKTIQESRSRQKE